MTTYTRKSRTERVTVSASGNAVTVTRSEPWSPGGTFPADDPAAVAREIAAELEEDGFTEETCGQRPAGEVSP